VEIQLANTNGALKSGSFAKAAIQTRYDAGVPTVPLEAIVRFAGITKIFVIDKGKARELQVSIGTATDRWVEITGTKLPKNAQVVTSGQTVLSDGASIYVRPSSITARGTEHQPARD
jgi:multidrug efflux pump subunit AcrA (membrane-fusion protein)